MDFIRIKEDIIRLDMITRIREGKNEETFYGRSVRKSTECWLEIYFVGGDVLKLEGDSAIALRRFLDQSCAVKDLNGPPPAEARHPSATQVQPTLRATRGPHV